MIELPRGAMREYLLVFGVAAVYVAMARDGSHGYVGTSRDLQKTGTRIAWRYEFATVFWVRDAATARTLTKLVRRELRHVESWSLVEAAVEIEAVAKRQGIALTDHSVAMARVTSALQRVDGELKRAQAMGGLSWFNRAYRAWRLAAKGVGRGMSYAEAKARLRKVVIKRLLVNGQIDGTMLGEVFPAIE